MDLAASTSKNITTEVPKSNEDKLNKEQAKDDDDESPNKNHHLKNAEDLPLEYDKRDSRWTLRYREPAPGLVELMEYSGVYVNADKLAECKTFSNDCLTLSRRLLIEIFTTNALSINTVGDASDRDNDNGPNVSPGLDVHALIILLKFVAEYGLENDWYVTDYQCIQNSIRQKMEVMRYVAKKFNYEENAHELLKKKVRQDHSGLALEYDENDTRWTLKYRELAPGLVELIEHSDVYVNADKLTECKRLANDCKTLAQMLLTEVFTTNALQTCSLSEKNRIFFGRTPAFPCLKHLQPSPSKKATLELDAHAEIILLNFVDEYGMEKGWTILDFEIIRFYFLQKIQEICYLRCRLEKINNSEFDFDNHGILGSQSIENEGLLSQLLEEYLVEYQDMPPVGAELLQPDGF